VRIVAWNCRMALAKKREMLYQLRPDIAVIPECSRNSMQVCKAEGFDTCWWGENQHKGLGVLARRPWALERIGKPGLVPRQRWIAPVRVQGPTEFLLLAVWAGSVGYRKEMNYVGQIHEAVVRHPEWFAADRPVVMGGDFNSNRIWDSGRKVRNHSAVVKLLYDRNLVSTYHTFFAEEQGRETRPTYYFWHKKDRPFHIDYLFAPRSWAARITNVEVGVYEIWRPTSDHVPILVDIEEENLNRSRAIAAVPRA
jgi:exonuclease III